MANSVSDLTKLKLIALGGSGNILSDLERSYYSGLSGLPAQRSINDHKRAYYAATAGVSPVGRSLRDLEFAFWTFISAGNNVGSWSDRARIFYA